MIDLMCLATVVYLEARGEPYEGQMAVAEVVINRVKNENFPNEPCDVIMQHGQFSYREGLESEVLDTMSYQAAYEVLTCGSDLTDGATYFHTTNVNPYWADSFEYTVTIGNHVFYRNGP